MGHFTRETGERGAICRHFTRSISAGFAAVAMEIVESSVLIGVVRGSGQACTLHDGEVGKAVLICSVMKFEHPYQEAEA